MFVAYASSPGRTASDRGDKSGVYAAALAAELLRPGLDHLNLFQNVKEAVLASTNGVQQPWESNGLSRRIYLTGQPNLDPALVSRVSEATEVWDRTKDTKELSVLDAFAARYKDTPYAGLARSRIEGLQKQAALQPPVASGSADPQIACSSSPVEISGRCVAKPPNEAKLRALAQSQGIPLPQRIVYVTPQSTTPPELADYFGAWGGDDRWHGNGRQIILVVTSIDNSGHARGFIANGPPNRFTESQYPANLGFFNGVINRNGLNFATSFGHSPMNRTDFLGGCFI
jgi:hypothetical protein